MRLEGHCGVTQDKEVEGGDVKDDDSLFYKLQGNRRSD